MLHPQASLLALLLALPALAAAEHEGPKAGADALPPGPGAAILERSCTSCHGLDVIRSAHKSRSQWEATVDQMVARGARLSDEEIDVLCAWLAEHMGR